VNFTVFGALPAANFGGMGIPNDAVAITTFVDAGNTITLGLAATERFFNAPVGDDGAGTYTAGPGSNMGNPGMGPQPSGISGATWNFSFYVDIQGGGTISNYIVQLLYDLRPGAATDESLHGVIDFNAAGLGGVSLIQSSQNPLFNFLSAGAPGVTPPGVVFDPNAAGEYTFALRVSAIGAGLLGESAIRVNVVPEPATLAIMGLGLVGIGIARRRKRA
jgi:hypothetical protein